MIAFKISDIPMGRSSQQMAFDAAEIGLEGLDFSEGETTNPRLRRPRRRTTPDAPTDAAAETRTPQTRTPQSRKEASR